MARTGRFGRLPRTAPNLASTIVQMVREVNQQEDANIIQAWEEGGLYKGKKVTDGMLLDHFRSRRDSMSKTDPLWDKWNTQLQNYEFAIEESKMSLAYAEKRVNEGQMANFYRKWAGKLPKDSEAYRNLMRSAAQFADAAKAAAGRGGGGGSGRRRASGGSGRRSSSRRSGDGDQEAYNSQVMSAYERYEKKWDDAQYYMINAAYRAGILQITDTADPDDLMDLRGGDEADHQRFLDLFDLINTDPYYADIKEAMAAEGLGGLTYAQFLAYGDTKVAGIDARIQIARAHGDDKGAEDLLEEKTEFITQRALVNDIDEFAWYQGTRQTLDDRIAQGGLSPFEVRDLLADYSRGLLDLRNSATSEQTRGFLNNELQALMGEGTVGPTAFEGNEGGIRTKTSDSQHYAALFREANHAVEMIESGRAFMTAGMSPEGIAEYGFITKDDMRLRDPLAGRVVFNGQGAGDNRTIPTYVQFQPMYVQGTTQIDPRTGQPGAQVAPQGSAALGVTFTLNGHTYYGVMAGQNGQQVIWYNDNPFAQGTRLDYTEDGLVITRSLSDADMQMDPSGRPVWDPLSVLSPMATNPIAAEQDSTRFTSMLEAVYDTDPVARQALLRASDADIALIAEVAPDPEGMYAEMRGLRNNIVDLHEQRIGMRARFGAAQQGRETEGLADRIAGSEEHFERTGESKAEKERVLNLLRTGAEWEDRYRQMNPTTATDAQRAARPSDPSMFRNGYLDPTRGAVYEPGPRKTMETVLPEIKMPQMATPVLPQQGGPRPVDLIGGPMPTYTRPAAPVPDEEPVTPKPKPREPVTPRPPVRTPTSPRSPEEFEEDEDDDYTPPKIITPVWKPPVRKPMTRPRTPTSPTIR